MLSPIERLLAIEDIKNLKARYFQFLDSHDWVGFRSLFEDDAMFAVPKVPDQRTAKTLGFDAPGQIEGADVIVAWVSKAMDEVHSAHMGYMPEIEIISADEARGIWGMEDIVRWPGRIAHGHGYYRESYVRRGGVWRIKTWALFYKSMEIRDLGTTATSLV